MRNFLALIMLATLTACVTTPTGGHQLTATGKIALQEISGIALSRYLREHPGRATEIVANVRNIANRLQTVTDLTTISGLRARVDAEVAKLPLSDLDRQDATRVLNIFEALLRDQIGSDAIDSQALVKVSDFLKMVIAALPTT